MIAEVEALEGKPLSAEQLQEIHRRRVIPGNPISLQNRFNELDDYDDEDEDPPMLAEEEDEDIPDRLDYSLPGSDPSDDEWHVTDTEYGESDSEESLQDEEENVGAREENTAKSFS